MRALQNQNLPRSTFAPLVGCALILRPPTLLTDSIKLNVRVRVFHIEIRRPEATEWNQSTQAEKRAILYFLRARRIKALFWEN